MANDSLSQHRLQLLAHGYKIIPCKAKVPALPGWNTQDYLDRELRPVAKGSVADRVARWPRRWPEARSTGVRVEGGLIVIDIDVDDGAVVEQLMTWLRAQAPAAAFDAPMRYGASPHKLALFARAAVGDAAFIRRASRKYDGHQVEVFGGEKLKGERCSRQFVVDGPHSYNDDGSVAAEYGWCKGPTLHEVDLAELPQITAAQISGLIDCFEALAAKAGWQVAAAPDTESGAIVYDISDDTRFDTNHGDVGIDYASLCGAFAAHGDGLRCSSNFMPGRGLSGRVDRCLVGDQNRHGVVAVWVPGDEVLHFPAELDDGYSAEKLAEQLRGLAGDPAEQPPARPDDAAELHEKAAWLVETHVYHAGEDAIVPLHATTLDSRIKPVAFQRLYRPWQVSNKRFKRPVYATDLWEASPARLNIAGVRMRPDMPFPLYTEAGQLFKNTYRRPQHDATGGCLGPFVAFLERFIPEAREREWLLDWLAHKQARPEIPGTSVFYVADNDEGVRKGRYGTGRGLMFRILRKLHGEDYCRSQSFAMLDGSSGQSQFNDWLHGSILVTVDESRSSPTSYRQGERNAAYEVLKELVDPAPKPHRFNGKNRQAFDGMSYCSIMVASNHGDALAIPAEDRRFTVLRNGREITREEAIEIDAWMQVPANIGALSAWLAARDLAGFDMFEPLDTASKADMAEMALTDVEETLRDMMEDPSLGKAFTRQQLEHHLEHHFSVQGTYWRGEFKAAWHAYCVGLKTPAGNPRRLYTYGTQRKLFCFRPHRREVDHMPEAAIRRQAAKWGGVDPSKDLKGLSGLNKKDE